MEKDQNEKLYYHKDIESQILIVISSEVNSPAE